MARIFFENPNDPEQPAAGVYRWYFRAGSMETTIYVGCAGNRRESVGAPSTLKRGILEAQRSCVTSDKGKLLDTDFVVGTALQFFKARGQDCIWQHVSDAPREELAVCQRYRPLLQTHGANIDRRFRPGKPGGETWSRADIAMAETLLLDVFAQAFEPAHDV